MAEPFLDLLRARFPRVDELALNRVLARGHTIFFDRKTGKKLLPEFTEDEVFTALFIAKTEIAKAGAELVLTIAEERILRGYLVPVSRYRQ